MKKILKIFIACLLAIALFTTAYLVIYPKICSITIMITRPVDVTAEQYFEGIMLAYSYMPESKQTQATTLTEESSQYRLAFWEEHKEDAYHIEVEVGVENGQTIVVYSGTITDRETGEARPHEKKFVYDFVLTKDVQ